MRWINKRNVPRELTEWRQRNLHDVNFGYSLLRQDHIVSDALLNTLITEQGALCAYTGRRITTRSCHMEHVKPQDFCSPAEAVDYRNIVACYPEPNRSQKCAYGADKKGNFPSASEAHLFVSPLDKSCEHRFRYTYAGKVRPADESDEAARVTIDKLALDHEELRELRRAAIRAILKPGGKELSLEKARHLLSSLQRQDGGALPQYQFVLVQAINNHIAAHESVVSRMAKKPQS